MNDDNEIWIKTLLEPLRAKHSEVFVQQVMRKVRAYEQPREWLFWRNFARWAMPALAFSVTSFAAAMLYTTAPNPISTDALLLEDREPTVSTEWMANPPNEDQILDSVVAKP